MPHGAPQHPPSASNPPLAIPQRSPTTLLENFEKISHFSIFLFFLVFLTLPGLGSGTVRIYIKFDVFWWY